MNVLDEILEQVEIRKSLNDSILGNGKKLECFKRELLKILDGQGEKEIRKSEEAATFYYEK